MFLRASTAIISMCLLAQVQPVSAQDRASGIRSNYTKHEFLIPMRDGVKLFTSVYTPKDTSQAWPMMMMRTPYSVAPYGIDNYRSSLGPSDKFLDEKFIFVYQDVRGRNKSEGKFVHVRPMIAPDKRGPKDIDESTDTYDTIDWLVKSIANNNGRVGMYGISYPGFYAAAGAVAAHPALKATSPQAPVYDWFVGDDFRHNGVLFLAHAFGFFSGFGRPAVGENQVAGPRLDMGTPDGYEFHLRTGALANYDEKYFHGQIEFWKELMENDTYNEFWKARVMKPYLKNVTTAVMCVGGWFDAEDVHGPRSIYQAIEAQSLNTQNTLVYGPWSHGGWSRGDGEKLGNISFGSKTSAFYRDNIEYPYFLWHLKGKGEGNKLPEAYMFNTGRNEWKKLDSWPPKQGKTKAFYLTANGKLADAAAGEAGFDEYISDPAKPVPFFDGIVNGMTYDYMTGDQRHATSRPDVLSYQTAPLEGDFTVAGPFKASLYVSTTGTDSDFVVKLIDVYPGDAPNPSPNINGVQMGGYQSLVRGEPFRGKFRAGFDNPQPFAPGKVEKIEFELPDIYHTFRRGHRIMVHVQSTWYPLGDRNPQKFMHIQEARATDFQKATERVYRGPGQSSTITVLTVE